MQKNVQYNNAYTMVGKLKSEIRMIGILIMSDKKVQNRCK